jgi:hypothetical protein
MWHFLLGDNARVTYDVGDLIGLHIAIFIALLIGYILAKHINWHR